MRLNINSEVRVRLTPKDLAQLEKNHNEIFGTKLSMLNEYPFRAPETDTEGYCRIQLWTLMSEFGPFMCNGMELLFDTNIDVPMPVPGVPVAEPVAAAAPATWEPVRLPNGAREIDILEPDSLGG
jgi:hypothetical protein